MAEQTFSIEFKGYWRDINKNGVPSKSGLYCVYECTYDTDKETVALNKLIYIGESENVHDRLANHEKYNDWKKHVSAGNTLCFSFGPVGSADRDRCEAALIFKHKPPENTEYKNSFPFDTTTMKLSGRTALLASTFTVYRA